MTRERTKSGCVRLGGFAVKPVEAMAAGDEKGVGTNPMMRRLENRHRRFF